MPNGLGARVVQCAQIGLFVSTAFSGIGLIAYFLIGSEAFTQELGSLTGLVVTNLVGGASSGVIVGLLLDRVTSAPAAIAVAVAAGVPYFAAAGVFLFGDPFSWHLDRIIVLVVMEVLFSGVVGYFTWEEFERRRLEKE